MCSVMLLHGDSGDVSLTKLCSCLQRFCFMAHGGVISGFLLKNKSLGGVCLVATKRTRLYVCRKLYQRKGADGGLIVT
jgi:hypothetical protein